MSWKAINIAMLATDTSKIYTDCYNRLRYAYKEYSRGTLTGAIMQHLYITSDEKLKNGDLVLTLSTGNYFILRSLDHIENVEHHYKKIIASTDPKLDKIIKNHNDFDTKIELPQPSKQFIELYCSLGGKGEFEIEFETKKLQKPADVYSEEVTYLKVNPDNTINIRQVAEKVYTRDEVETLLFNLAEHYAMTFSKSEIDDFNEWMEENMDNDE